MENRIVKLLTSLAFVFLGIMLILNPSSISNLLVLSLGLASILYAAINFIRYRSSANKFTLIFAIVLAILGFVLMLQPLLRWKIYDKIFAILLGLFLIVVGLLFVKEYLMSTDSSKFIGIALGAIIVIIGLITLLIRSFSLVSILIGITCIIIGAMQVYGFMKERL